MLSHVIDMPRSEKYAHWIGKLSNLNAAWTEARGTAPHKPLMLLTIIDLIENGDFSDGWVKYDVRIVSRFRDYWELVRERQRNQPDIPMPFHALGGHRDQIWQRFTSEGQPSKAKATTRLCFISPDLFSCLQDPDFRSEAREALVLRYFTASEQVMLCSRLGLSMPSTCDVDALRKRADEFKARQKKGRDSRFKSDVLSGYYFTCALTGYRLDTETSSIVQACHIHEHSKSGNDDPRNGLALTPDAHWMFDAGLWTAVPEGNGYRVKVSRGRFDETPGHIRGLSTYDGGQLCFHSEAKLRPLSKHLDWHRKYHGI